MKACAEATIPFEREEAHFNHNYLFSVPIFSWPISPSKKSEFGVGKNGKIIYVACACRKLA